MPVVTFVFGERYGHLVFRVCFRSPGVTSSSLTDMFGFGFGDFEQSTQRILLSHVLEKSESATIVSSLLARLSALVAFAAGSFKVPI